MSAAGHGLTLFFYCVAIFFVLLAIRETYRR
jgi:hypothetical protein